MARFKTYTVEAKATNPKTRQSVDFSFSFDAPIVKQESDADRWEILKEYMGTWQAVFSACREQVKRDAYVKARSQAIGGREVIAGDDEAGY